MPKKLKKNKEELVYCNSNKAQCDRRECLRHRSNEPFNVMIQESEEYHLTPTGRCGGYIIE